MSGDRARAVAGAVAARAEAVMPVSAGCCRARPAGVCGKSPSHPGSSSAQVQAGVGIRHPSPVSTVLMRLERDGLAHADRGRRALNAWHVTQPGRDVLT